MNKARLLVQDIYMRSQKSIWTFPLILLIGVFALTALDIHGSSIGVYNTLFNGMRDDENLLLNKPRAIRSDEWVVNTQLSLAQYNSGLPETNTHIGNGMDMSIIIDAPAKSFWQIFKPHNFSFFVLPFSNALSFKWWIMAWALVVSIYLLVLKFLPNKKLIAAVFGLAILFSPFIQWWYQYITLAPIYYGIFSYLVALKLAETRKLNYKSYLLLILLVYLLISFALVQYPAFQIATLLVIAPLTIVGILENKRFGDVIRSKGFRLMLIACVLAVVTVGGFLVSKSSTLAAINDSAYPGKREIKSGGYNLLHLLSSHVSPIFQSGNRSSHYSIPASNAINQSESSNFILLLPFLIIPMAVAYFSHKEKLYKKTTLTILGITGILCLWLVIPGIDYIGKMLVLDKVPQARLVLSFGLLSIFLTILALQQFSRRKTKLSHSLFYALGVFVVCIGLSFYIDSTNAGFFRHKYELLVVSMAMPPIIFFILRGQALIASIVLLAVSIGSSGFVHPIYHGTDILSENVLLKTIKEVNGKQPGRWIAEDSLLENFPAMAGVDSLSGVFAYPDTDFWKSVAPANTNEDIYNRYAHITYNVDRNPTFNATRFTSPTGDHVAIYFEPCGEFPDKANLHYIVTSSPLNQPTNTCADLVTVNKFPNSDFFVYRLN